MTQSLVMLTTSGCHLCDVAQALLLERHPHVRLTKVDIAMDDALIERYGSRIPVLRAGNGGELDWPFNAAALQAWLAGLK